MKTLAKFVQKHREELGLTVKGLSIAANVPSSEIEEIEEGRVLFLPVTTRQSLAKVFKCEAQEIKALEKDISDNNIIP